MYDAANVSQIHAVSSKGQVKGVVWHRKEPTNKNEENKKSQQGIRSHIVQRRTKRRNRRKMYTICIISLKFNIYLLREKKVWNGEIHIDVLRVGCMVLVHIVAPKLYIEPNKTP